MSTSFYKVKRKVEWIAAGPEILQIAVVVIRNNTHKMVCVIKIRILEMLFDKANTQKEDPSRKAT